MEHLIPPARSALMLHLHHALPGRESLALLLIAQSNGLNKLHGIQFQIQFPNDHKAKLRLIQLQALLLHSFWSQTCQL